ncbi:MAG: MBL fold metallo-hydrolase [Candidatus Beckwithbacteria bacterium]|nr:MBL fold metallo-hydrolase [Candidatus Beckwithbacteria bacterium]
MDISLLPKAGFLLKYRNVKVTVEPEENKVEAEGETVVIKGAGEYEVKGVSIFGTKINKEVIYTFDIDELRVAYLGEFKEKLSDSQLDWLDGVDVLLVSGQSAEIVKQIGPSLAVSPEPIKGIEGMSRQEKKLTISKLQLPEEMKVIVLYA